MECLIGIRGKDFVLMATDSVAGRSVVAMKKGLLVVALSDNSGFICYKLRTLVSINERGMSRCHFMIVSYLVNSRGQSDDKKNSL